MLAESEQQQLTPPEGRMINRDLIARKMQDHYERVWKGNDPWDFEASEFDQARYARQLSLLDGRHYPRALEIGCGSGWFTSLLTGIADWVLALDIAPSAIACAKAQVVYPGAVDFRVANIMDYDLHAEGPWDLVVFSETIYCLGWLYPLFDVGWLAAELFDATRDGGRLLLVNTYGGEKDYLLRPWLIHTYRHLFLNVGYRLEAEKIFRGRKNTVDLEVLMDVFEKACDAGTHHPVPDLPGKAR